MDINIVKGSLKHLNYCVQAVFDSKLGEYYFTSQERLSEMLKEGLIKKEIYVALDHGGRFIGFIWFTLNGAFNEFPYVHLIAVKKEFRRQGVGRKLLAYYEENGFVKKAKLFLMVSSFNQLAKKLYISMGYQEVGVVPDLLKEGISEYIMVKSKAQ